MNSSALNEKPDEQEDHTQAYTPQFAVTSQGLHYHLGADGADDPAQVTAQAEAAREEGPLAVHAAA